MQDAERVEKSIKDNRDFYKNDLTRIEKKSRLSFPDFLQGAADLATVRFIVGGTMLSAITCVS